jgi:hypothetical protein
MTLQEQYELGTFLKDNALILSLVINIILAPFYVPWLLQKVFPKK